MKTPNFFKAITLMVILVVSASVSASAANYYAYKGKEVTINGGSGFSEYKWIMVSQPDPAITNAVITGTTGSQLKQTLTVEGAYKLRLLVKDGNGCWSDVDATKDIDIFVLPEFTVTVAADAGTPASYCTNADASLRTKLNATAATVTGSVALPSEVTIALADWYKTPSDGSLASLTKLATSNPYQVTETAVGTYYFVATGKYVIPTGRLISAAADATASNTITISVTAPPTAPVITPVVTN
ncbi:hypothetical protein [Pedobacter duraquae]|uniref:Uncharacterized protein n=1 Tax=Pedobacter duraquae TaxID=425511 RepID=A0A4R6IPU5_9SPHI|nr:hypothetical protein [Pedobacter duraquae]TDO24329.1 hypothetical protein CLV32_0618 [Pedobacter duraquae]